MKHLIYGNGGFNPDMPSGNLQISLDTSTNQYTRWDSSGNVIENRPLTTAELAEFDQSNNTQPDLPTLAAQVTALTDAVDDLIVQSLGGA